MFSILDLRISAMHRPFATVITAFWFMSVWSLALAQAFASPLQTRAGGQADAGTGREAVSQKAGKGTDASSRLVLSLAVSPNGERILSGDSNGSVTLYASETGDQIWTVKGHTGPVASVAFSTDGGLVLSGGADGVLKLMDPDTNGEELLSIQGYEGPTNQRAITSVSISPDGNQFLSAAGDKTLRLWDKETGKEIRSFKGHADTISEAAFSPNGKRIVSGGRDKLVMVWDVTSGQSVHILKGHTGLVSSVDFSHDGKRIISGSWDKTLKIWDAETGQELATLKGHSKGVNRLAISGDGKRVLSGGNDKELNLWNIDDGESPQKFVGHTGEVIAVAINADGTRVVSAGKDKRVQVWDTEKLSPLFELALADQPEEVAEAPKATAERSKGAKGSAASSDQPLLAIKVPNGASRPSWSKDGQRIAAAVDSVPAGAESVKVWSTTDGRELATLSEQPGRLASAIISPDGKRVISVDGKSMVKGWDVGKRTEQFSFKGPNAFGVMTFSPDGKFFILGGFNPMVSIRDAEKGGEVRALKSQVRSQSVVSVAYSPDGKRVAAGTMATPALRKPADLKIWDAETGQELLTIHPAINEADITGLAFSPDGKRIAAAISDRLNHKGEIQVWDTEKGEEILSLQGHKKEAMSVAYSPDGKIIATGSEDGTFRLWGAENGIEIRSYKVTAERTTVSFSPDGKRLASTDRGEIRIWDLSTVEPRPGAIPQAVARTSKPSGGQAQGQQPPGGNRPMRLQVGTLVKVDKPILTFKGHTFPVNSLAYTGDGKKIVTGSGDNTVKIWDADKGTELLTLEGHKRGVNGVVFDADGKRVISCAGDGTIKIWDAVKGTEIATLGQPSTAFHDLFCVDLSPDGKRIASGSFEKTITLWDPEKKAEITKLTGHNDRVTTLAYSPDGKRLVSGSAGNTAQKTIGQVKIWDVATGKEMLNLDLGMASAMKVTFSPDGKHIAAALGTMNPHSGEVKVWDAAKGTELFTLLAEHKGPVMSVAYSSDGKRLVTASWDASIRIWDAQKGDELRAFLYSNPAGAIFSPDGQRIASSINAGSGFQIWDTTEPKPDKPAPTEPAKAAAAAAPQPKPVAPSRRSSARNTAKGNARMPAGVMNQPGGNNPGGFPPGPDGPGFMPEMPVNREAAERVARACAAKGDWAGAVQNYALMFQAQGIDNGEPGFEAAAVLLLAGNRAVYRQTCADLYDRSPLNLIRPYHMARAFTLAPDSIKDFSIPSRKAADELMQAQGAPWALTQRGALACRAGQYAEAAKLLEESEKLNTPPGVKALNWFWLAVLEARRNNPEAARTWLEKGTKWMSQVSPDGITMPANPNAYGVDLHNWLEYVILRREAEALLRK